MDDVLSLSNAVLPWDASTLFALAEQPPQTSKGPVATIATNSSRPGFMTHPCRAISKSSLVVGFFIFISVILVYGFLTISKRRRTFPAVFAAISFNIYFTFTKPGIFQV
jgi:hypothetical protein